MGEDIDFLDTVLVSRIDKNTTLENFGGKINTSFFEAANLLGRLKVKGLVTFEQTIGGHSPVKLTDKAHTILSLIKEKSEERFDNLDSTILKVVANGADNHIKVEKGINIASFDVALHLNKLYYKGYLDYFIRSGRVTLRLTEKGFAKVKGKAVRYSKGDTRIDSQEGDTDDGRDVLPQSSHTRTSSQTAIGHEEHEESQTVNLTEEELRRRMMMSKIEFYVRKYWWIGVLGFLILVGIILFAVFKVLGFM